jgi:hypothetical protein
VTVAEVSTIAAVDKQESMEAGHSGRVINDEPMICVGV